MTDNIRRCASCGKPLIDYQTKYCSVQCYHAAPHSIYCEHVCVDCGKAFVGHIRSTRCPDCRAKHKTTLARECRLRSRMRKTREIGSNDLCARCGAPYTVTNPAQKYCERCASIAIRERILARNKLQQNQRCEKRKRQKVERMNTIKNAIAQKRVEYGLTQKELAEKIGCYPKDICRWETGVRKPTTESLVKIAKALGCTLDDLVT